MYIIIIFQFLSLPPHIFPHLILCYSSGMTGIGKVEGDVALYITNNLEFQVTMSGPNGLEFLLVSYS